MEDSIVSVRRVIHAELSEVVQASAETLRVGWRVSLFPSKAEVFIALRDLEVLESSLRFRCDPQISRVLNALGCEDPKEATELLDNFAA